MSKPWPKDPVYECEICTAPLMRYDVCVTEKGEVCCAACYSDLANDDRDDDDEGECADDRHETLPE